jgi:hypothetical protein
LHVRGVTPSIREKITLFSAETFVACTSLSS